MNMQAVKSDIAQAIASIADMNVENDNYIGALCDAAVSQKQPAPSYEYGRDISPDHQPVFACKCTLLGCSATGKGGSKRAAKHAASKAFVEELR